MKLSGIKYLTDQGIENIWKNKMMAFATFCVLLISLLLVGMSVLFYINTNSMIEGLSDHNEIEVIMELNSSDETNHAAEEAIRNISNVKSVTFKPKEQALAEIKPNDSRVDKIFNEFIKDDASFMPDGFIVTVKDSELIDDTSAQIRTIAGVQKTESSPQIAEFLRELRKVVGLIAGAVILTLAIVSMIMISNTTKASVFARREEIQIMKYVGATNTFIKMPFFVEGLITGLIAGIFSFVITWIVYTSVYDVLTHQQYLMQAVKNNSLIPFNRIILPVLAAYFVVGAFVGAMGSVISTRKHIDV